MVSTRTEAIGRTTERMPLFSKRPYRSFRPAILISLQHSKLTLEDLQTHVSNILRSPRPGSVAQDLQSLLLDKLVELESPSSGWYMLTEAGAQLVQDARAEHA